MVALVLVAAVMTHPAAAEIRLEQRDGVL